MPVAANECFYYIYGIILLMSCIAGVALNGTAVLVFIKQKQLKTMSNVLVMCLCMVDFTMASIGTPMAVIANLAKYWIFGHGGCVYYAFLTSFLGILSITLLTLIAIDRFIVIVTNIWKKYKTKCIVIFVLVGAIIHSFIWAAFPMIGWNSYTLEAMDTSCSITWQSNNVGDLSYSMTLFCVAFVLPITIIGVCYLAIIKKIKNQSQMFASGLQNFAAKVEKRMAITSLIMIVAFILTWGPYAAFSVYVAVNDPKDILPEVAAIPAVFAKMSLFWNPVIYLHRNSEFRKAFYAEFPRIGKQCSNQISVFNIEISNTQGEELQNMQLTPRLPTLDENFTTNYGTV